MILKHLNFIINKYFYFNYEKKRELDVMNLYICKIYFNDSILFR